MNKDGTIKSSTVTMITAFSWVAVAAMFAMSIIESDTSVLQINGVTVSFVSHKVSVFPLFMAVMFGLGSITYGFLTAANLVIEAMRESQKNEEVTTVDNEATETSPESPATSTEGENHVQEG